MGGGGGVVRKNCLTRRPNFFWGGAEYVKICDGGLTGGGRGSKYWGFVA